MREFAWRAWLRRMLALWRSSLQLRTVAIAVLLSGSAIAIIGATMALSVGNNLFEAQREQVTATTVNATLAAQRVFDQAAEQLGPQDRDVTVFAAAEAIARAAPGAWFTIPPAQGQSGITSGPDPDELRLGRDHLEASCGRP